MPRKSLNEAWKELKDAWDMANHGYKAEPQGGLAGKFSPKYSPLSDEESAPSEAPSPNQSFAALESRLRQVHQLYESGKIDYEDYEREKARILSEI
jgi:hypothetical protein